MSCKIHLPRRRFLILHTALLIAVAMLFCSLVLPVEAGAKAPPETRQDNVKENVHGVEIVDPYRWLEDQESPETRAWIEAQNDYTQRAVKSADYRTLENRPHRHAHGA